MNDNQQVSESNLWQDRYHRFKLMGAKRSILAVYKDERRQRARESAKGSDQFEKLEAELKRIDRVSSAPHSWRIAADQYQWVTRAELWDIQQREQREREFQQFWEEHRDKMMQLSLALCDRAEKMLKHPLVKQEIRKTHIAEKAGEEIPVLIVVQPAKWTFATAATYGQMAHELALAAVGDIDRMIEHLTAIGYEVKVKSHESCN